MGDYFVIFITTFALFMVVFLLLAANSKRRAKKEEIKYLEAHSVKREAEKVDAVDPVQEVLVFFEFVPIQGQSLLKSNPNITIDHKELYKMFSNHLVLKLSPSFQLDFGVPYMGSNAFKYSEKMNLEVGNKYRITFRPRTLVFSKPKVEIVKMGPIQ